MRRAAVRPDAQSGPVLASTRRSRTGERRSAATTRDVCEGRRRRSKARSRGEFMLDPIGGAMFHTALRRIERELYRADKRDGVTRTTAERLAAALVEMAKRATACPADAQKPGPLLMVLAGQESLAQICELSTGVVIDPHLVVPYLGEVDCRRSCSTVPTDRSPAPRNARSGACCAGRSKPATATANTPPGVTNHRTDRRQPHRGLGRRWPHRSRRRQPRMRIPQPHPDLHDKAPPPGTPRAGPPRPTTQTTKPDRTSDPHPHRRPHRPPRRPTTAGRLTGRCTEFFANPTRSCRLST